MLQWHHRLAALVAAGRLARCRRSQLRRLLAPPGLVAGRVACRARPPAAAARGPDPGLDRRVRDRDRGRGRRRTRPPTARRCSSAAPCCSRSRCSPSATRCRSRASTSAASRSASSSASRRVVLFGWAAGVLVCFLAPAVIHLLEHRPPIRVAYNAATTRSAPPRPGSPRRCSTARDANLLLAAVAVAFAAQYARQRAS